MKPPTNLAQSGKDSDTVKKDLSKTDEFGDGSKGPDGKPVTWNEFTQATTFHGIKYIFDPS